MLSLRVAEALGLADPAAPLAIASCGNAALAAAVVARAARRRLLVFVPPQRRTAVIERLRALERRDRGLRAPAGRAGDPTLHRLMEAIAAGAVPFTVQGNLNGLAIEGGADAGLGAHRPAARRRLSARPTRHPCRRRGLRFGRGAGLRGSRGLGQIERLPVIDTVQTQGGYPLARAYERVLDAARRRGRQARRRGGCGWRPCRLARHRSEYMWAWETEPVAIAHGILDDETYDWLAVVRAMLLTGGRTIVVDEATLEPPTTWPCPTSGSTPTTPEPPASPASSSSPATDRPPGRDRGSDLQRRPTLDGRRPSHPSPQEEDTPP